MKITATYDFETHKVELYGRDGIDILTGTMSIEGDPCIAEPFLSMNYEDAVGLFESLWGIGIRPKDFDEKYIEKSALTVPSGCLIEVADINGEREYLQTQLDAVMKQNSKLMDVMLAVLRDE